MLTKKQVSEIREHLEKAQNPVFFFDNDADGLCSFILLQRFIGRGKGVAVKSFPDMNAEYFRKVEEFNADYIFILDKPVVSEDFFKKVEEKNVPCVWIDHHDVQSKIPKFVNYYNPVLNKPKTNEPVTALCYQITNKKDDLWIAVAGSISDKFIPDFYKEFLKVYPDLGINSKDAFEIFYESDIGKIIQLMAFALKDRVSSVVSMMRFLTRVKSPYDVLTENSKNYTMYKRYNQIDKKYQELMKKAKVLEKESEKILFFQYGGDLSISSDLSNELSYRFPKKIIVVIYLSGAKANISIRGKNIREKVLGAIKDLENARGGGHEDAVGAQVQINDLETFKDNFEKIVDNNKI